MIEFTEKKVISPDVSTIQKAHQALKDIRARYPSTSGYVEVQGYIEPLEGGEWHAVRIHRKYDN